MDTALIVQGLRPQPFEVMLSSSSSLMFDRRLLPLDLLYMPVLPLAHLSSATLMTDAVLMMSQSLLGDVVNLQSLMGFSIDTSSDDTVAHSASIISTLLDAGLAYVTSDSGKLMGLFPALRSVLSLCSKDPISQPPIGAGTNRLPVGLQKRLRDMPRIFRNKVKRMLSFRINSDLDLAIRKVDPSSHHHHHHHHHQHRFLHQALLSLLINSIMVNSYESTTDRTVGLVIVFFLQTRTFHHYLLTQSPTY